MSHDDTSEDAMPHPRGHNQMSPRDRLKELREKPEEELNEKELGQVGVAVLKDSEKHYTQHDKVIGVIHQDIIKFGKILQAGRNLYPHDNNGFSEWVTTRNLNTGILGGTQQERTACRKIAELHEVGHVTEEDGHVPRKLDLTSCKCTRPTEVVKWARKNQPHLFPAQVQKPGLKKPAPTPMPADEVGDLGVGEDQRGDELSWLRGELTTAQERIIELEQEVADLRERLTVAG